ncbi:hypothetical protein C2E23DRAFT_727038 [Lenzites betulinus]|nr:hypothetical protein C2E23DRAFT_727038 [Lenzites betulinus]
MDSASWIAATLEDTFNLPFRQFHNPNVSLSFWGTLAHHDLRLYASLAILPTMELNPSLPPLPPPGHRGHANKLCVEHEQHRRLDRMYNIMAFPEAALECTGFNLPMTRTGDADFDHENGGGISVPARGFQINQTNPIGKPADIDKVLRWVLEYPLATANHMMHLVYPDTLDYTIQGGVVDDADRTILQWAKWGRDDITITEAKDTWSESVIFIVQPPWILTEADLERFVGCPTFPRPDSDANLRSHERLWGKIWDLCAQKHSHWFVLTTYWGWVFGAFSSARTCAFTSHVIPFDSKEPTIVQYLFFWLSSAVASHVHPHGAWSIPQVSAERARRRVQYPCTYLSICRKRKRFKERDALFALKDRCALFD